MQHLRQTVEQARVAFGLPPLIDHRFALALRNKREKAGISLRKLAKEANISPTYLSRVETAQSAPPSEGVIKAIASIIGADEYELLLLANKLPTSVTEALLRLSADELRKLESQLH